MTTSFLLKTPLSTASTQKAHVMSDGVNRRVGAEALCQAWLSGEDGALLADAFKQTVAYASIGAVGKACIYRALHQLGHAHHMERGTRENKRWWQHLDAQFGEGKAAWREIESGLKLADEAATLRHSLQASREKLRDANREIATLRATIDSLLIHVRGEAVLQQQLQALLKSLASAQHENQVLQQEVNRLRADSSRPASITSLEGLLRRPNAASPQRDAKPGRFVVPSLDALLASPPLSDAPPSYPHTPLSELNLPLTI